MAPSGAARALHGSSHHWLTMQDNISGVHLPVAEVGMFHCGDVISWLFTKSKEGPKAKQCKLVRWQVDIQLTFGSSFCFANHNSHIQHPFNLTYKNIKYAANSGVVYVLSRCELCNLK